MRLSRVRVFAVESSQMKAPRVVRSLENGINQKKKKSKEREVAQFKWLQQCEDVTVSLQIHKKLPPLGVRQETMGLNYSKGDQ